MRVKRGQKRIESLIDPMDPGHSGADNFRPAEEKESVSGGKWRLAHPVYNTIAVILATRITPELFVSAHIEQITRDNRPRMRVEARIERDRRISLA